MSHEDIKNIFLESYFLSNITFEITVPITSNNAENSAFSKLVGQPIFTASITKLEPKILVWTEVTANKVSIAIE